jgi:hypothetical protein
MRSLGIPPYAPQDRSQASWAPCLRNGMGLWQPEAALQPQSLICVTVSSEFGIRGVMMIANGGMSWVVVRAAKPCRCSPHVPRLRRHPPFPCNANP